MKKTFLLTLLALLPAWAAQAITVKIGGTQLQDGSSYSGSFLREGSVSLQGNTLTFTDAQLELGSSGITITGTEDEALTLLLQGYNTISHSGDNAILFNLSCSLVVQGSQGSSLTLTNSNGYTFTLRKHDLSLTLRDATVTVRYSKASIVTTSNCSVNIENSSFEFTPYDEKSKWLYDAGTKPSTVTFTGSDFSVPAGGRMDENNNVQVCNAATGEAMTWKSGINIRPVHTYPLRVLGRQVNTANAFNPLGLYDENLQSKSNLLFNADYNMLLLDNASYATEDTSDGFLRYEGNDVLTIGIVGSCLISHGLDGGRVIDTSGPLGIRRFNEDEETTRLEIRYTGTQKPTSSTTAIYATGDVGIDIDEFLITNQSGGRTTDSPMFNFAFATRPDEAAQPWLRFGEMAKVQLTALNGSFYGFSGGIDLGSLFIETPENGYVAYKENLHGYAIGSGSEGQFSTKIFTSLRKAQPLPLWIGGVQLHEGSDLSALVQAGQMTLTRQDRYFDGYLYDCFTLTLADNTVLDTRGTTEPAIRFDAQGFTPTRDKGFMLAIEAPDASEDQQPTATILADADAVSASGLQHLRIAGTPYIESTQGNGLQVTAPYIWPAGIIKGARHGISGKDSQLCTVMPATIEGVQGATSSINGWTNIENSWDYYISQPTGGRLQDATFVAADGTPSTRVTFSRAGGRIVVAGVPVGSDDYRFTTGLKSGYISATSGGYIFHDVHLEGETGIETLEAINLYFEGTNVIKAAHGDALTLKCNKSWSTHTSNLTASADNTTLRLEATEGAAMNINYDAYFHQVNVQVNATLVGSTYGVYTANDANKLCINSCSFSAFGRGMGSIVGLGKLEVIDMNLVQPALATYEKGAMRLNGTDIIKSAVVFQPTAPDLTIDGWPVTLENAAFTQGVSGGKVSYDFARRTLVLEDVVANWPRGISIGQDMTVELKGDNTITCAATAAIELKYISGTGSERQYTVTLSGDEGASLRLSGAQQGIHVSKTGQLRLGSGISLSLDVTDYGISGLDPAHNSDTEAFTTLDINSDIDRIDINGAKNGCITGFKTITWDYENAWGARFLQPAGCSVVDGMVVNADGLAVTGRLVYGTPADLSINGVAVNTTNAADIPVTRSGKASFDFATHTLTLADATIEGSQGIDIGYVENVFIRLIGRNTLKVAHTALRNREQGSVYINGSGSLIIEADSVAALELGGLDISNTTVEAKGQWGIIGNDKSTRFYCFKADVQLNTTHEAVAQFDECSINLARLESPLQHSDSKGIYDHSGHYATGTVHILPLSGFLQLNNQEVTSKLIADMNTDGTLTKGNMAYDSAAHTLYLSGVSWKEGGVIITDYADLKIVVEGENELDDIIALGANSHVTISGKGSLDIDDYLNNPEYEAMLQESCGSITFDNTHASFNAFYSLKGKLTIQNSYVKVKDVILTGTYGGVHLKYAKVTTPADAQWTDYFSQLDDEMKALYKAIGYKALFTYVDKDGKLIGVEFEPDPTMPDAIGDTSDAAATDAGITIAARTVSFTRNIGAVGIYDAAGRHLSQLRTPATITLPASGLYLLHTAAGTHKVLVK